MAPKKQQSKMVAQKKKKPAVKKITKKITKKEIKTANKKKLNTQTIAQNHRSSGRNSVSQKPKPIYVGQMEMDALWMQNEMHREVTKKWQPPVGLSKELVCILNVLVDWSGNVAKTSIEQSSGALLYDISARTAMTQMAFPSWARGKEFTITFKQ